VFRDRGRPARNGCGPEARAPRAKTIRPRADVSLFAMPPRSGPPSAPASDAIQVGVRLHEAGHYAEAAKHFARILQGQPRHPLALWHAGRALTRLRQPQQSIALLQQAAAARPNAAEVLLDLARAWLVAGRPDDAIAHLQRVVELKPAWTEAWSTLGFAQARA